jgi:hypothetical protein
MKIEKLSNKPQITSVYIGFGQQKPPPVDKPAGVETKLENRVQI